MNNKKLLFVVLLLIPFSLCSYRIYNNATTDIIFVNVLLDDKVEKIELNDYIIGVVAAEMPASFHNEALKAQAVATRTFTLKKINSNNNYIFKGASSDQGYITKDEMKVKWQENYQKYYEKIKKVVFNTSNEIITYNGELIKAYYFSMSNGKTENAIYVFNENEQYLQGSNSQNELESQKMNNSIEISRYEFCIKMNISNCNKIIINDIKLTPSGRVEEITINNVRYTGVLVRQILKLRSTDFKIIINDNIKITTKGYGHGVGMSQYGAHYMAQSGCSYKEIIENYYPHTKIEKY